MMISMDSSHGISLIRAVKSGDMGQVIALLDRGASSNTSDRDGTTALMFAAQLGYTEIVRFDVSGCISPSRCGKPPNCEWSRCECWQ
jgi:ankyrin repeat protein